MINHYVDRFRGARPTPHEPHAWGYTSKHSYATGEELHLHTSTSANDVLVTIFRDGAERQVVHSARIAGSFQETPEDAFTRGCGWLPTLRLPIPPEWRPGPYVIELQATISEREIRSYAFFVLTNPTPTTGLAMVLATYTWQAYNDWGGGSSYSLDETHDDGDAAPSAERVQAARTGGGFAARLSLERPWSRGQIVLPDGAPRMALESPAPAAWAPRNPYWEWAYANGYSHWSGCAGWASFDSKFFKWAERQGLDVDLFTQSDLEQDPNPLRNYTRLITVGHDEYWSATGRSQLDDFISSGGRYIRLAGNILWRVRMEDGGKVQVCHKFLPHTDPLVDTHPEGSTGAFEVVYPSEPPVTTFGGNGTRGGYSRFGGSSPRAGGGMTVFRNRHWVFEGTDLYYGDVLGAGVPLVGYEADGVAYRFQDGLPYPTQEDGTPQALEILAWAPTIFEEEDHGHADGTLFTRDGDLAYLATALLGSDDEQTRARVRHGCAAMTWLEKGEGSIFGGGSTEWPAALAAGDVAVAQIVRNLLA